MDFAIGLVNSVLKLSDGQVKFWGDSNYRRSVINPAHQNVLGGGVGEGDLVKMTFGPVHAKSNYSLSKWQAVKLTFFAPCGENVRDFFP